MVTKNAKRYLETITVLCNQPPRFWFSSEVSECFAFFAFVARVQSDEEVDVVGC